MTRRYVKAAEHRRLCGTPAEGPSRAHYEFHRIHDGSPVVCDRALHEYAWAMWVRNNRPEPAADYPGWRPNLRAHVCAEALAAVPDARFYWQHRSWGTLPCLLALSGYRWKRWLEAHPSEPAEAYFDPRPRWRVYVYRFDCGGGYVGITSRSRKARDRTGYGYNPAMTRLLDGSGFVYRIVAGGLDRAAALRTERRWMRREAAAGRRLANLTGF